MIHQLRLFWRRRCRPFYLVVVAFALAAALAVASWARSPPRAPAVPALVDLTLVEHARDKGAVCLDGSPPGYHLQRGFGSGSHSWVIHLEGGGWCRDTAACSVRKHTELGSSDHMEKQAPFVGILSSVQSENPDFYNWNKVKVRYCDGASFSGYVKDEFQNGSTLFFRGKLIWEAVMDELLQKGLARAKQALLTGCSAGGLATYIHCDEFHALLPEADVKCFADGGFFLDEKDISGKRTLREYYSDVVQLQDLGKVLNCNSSTESAQCFFPREIISNIRTPLFILNPAYDAWQVQHVLAPEASDPNRSWSKCKLDIATCNEEQIKILQEFRWNLLNALNEAKQKQDWGLFINSCFVHCQTVKTFTWHSPLSPRINGKTIAEAVGDWYFDRREVKEIDCAYPCNPTCYNMIFSASYRL